MRLAALAIGVVLAFTGMAAAATYDTPEAMITAFYAPYLDNSENFDSTVFDAQADFRSSGLQALYDADAAATPEGEIGALDFDPYIGGQDWMVTDLEVSKAVIDGDTATLDVTFKNFGDTHNLTYDLVKEEGSWKIDDLVSKTEGDEYRLSEIFTLTQAD